MRFPGAFSGRLGIAIVSLGDRRLDEHENGDVAGENAVAWIGSKPLSLQTIDIRYDCGFLKGYFGREMERIGL